MQTTIQNVILECFLQNNINLPYKATLAKCNHTGRNPAEKLLNIGMNRIHFFTSFSEKSFYLCGLCEWSFKFPALWHFVCLSPRARLKH